MSADVLQRLTSEGKATIDDLADLLNLQQHSVYPYLSHRELRFGQLRTLVRQGPAELAEAFGLNLFGGTPYHLVRVDADLDADGDGDVDTDDAMRRAVETVEQAARAIRSVSDIEGGPDRADVELVRSQCRRLIQCAAAIEQIVEFVHQHQPRRRKARTPGTAPAAGTNGNGNGRAHHA